jgi:hypothetical protein
VEKLLQYVPLPYVCFFSIAGYFLDEMQNLLSSEHVQQMLDLHSKLAAVMQVIVQHEDYRLFALH